MSGTISTSSWINKQATLQSSAGWSRGRAAVKLLRSLDGMEIEKEKLTKLAESL